jgi:hypothetical protein
MRGYFLSERLRRMTCLKFSHTLIHQFFQKNGKITPWHQKIRKFSGFFVSCYIWHCEEYILTTIGIAKRTFWRHWHCEEDILTHWHCEVEI